MSRRQEREQAMCAALGVPLNNVANGIGDIYFLHSKSMKAIKIGFSFDVSKRIKQLATGSIGDLQLLGTIRGTTADEKALHKKFSTWRVHGEWFRPVKRLRDYISREAR